MKELYTVPEVNLISFVPDARIASFDFDDIENGIFDKGDGNLNDGSRVDLND